MHLRTTRRLADKYLKNCEKVYGLSKFHETTPYIEFQPYVQSPSWMTRYYNMGFCYSDHPYEVAAFNEEKNWKLVA